MKGFMIFLLCVPCAAQAAVYKCSTQGDTYFSQIPCEENAELVELDDTSMFSEPDQDPVIVPAVAETQPEPETNTEATPAENLREFVETLQRQRLEQVEGIDDNIIALESLMESAGNLSENDPDQARLAEQLNDLYEARNSIIDQYASMISEAERRVDELGAL